MCSTENTFSPNSSNQNDFFKKMGGIHFFSSIFGQNIRLLQDNHVFLFIGQQEQEQDCNTTWDRDAKDFWKERLYNGPKSNYDPTPQDPPQLWQSRPGPAPLLGLHN